MVYCSKCGKKNPDDAQYCDKCGVKLITESQLEKNIDDFGEEIEQIGKKIVKTVEDATSSSKSTDGKPKKLYRSGKDKIIAGVCGGLAEHFDVDPLLVRVIAIVLLVGSLGFMMLAYLLLWVIIPRNPEHNW